MARLDEDMLWPVVREFLDDLQDTLDRHNVKTIGGTLMVHGLSDDMFLTWGPNSELVLERAETLLIERLQSTHPKSSTEEIQ